MAVVNIRSFGKNRTNTESAGFNFSYIFTLQSVALSCLMALLFCSCASVESSLKKRQFNKALELCSLKEGQEKQSCFIQLAQYQVL